MRLTKNNYIQERMRVHGIVYGRGQSIDRTITRVVHSAQLEMALIARRT